MSGFPPALTARSPRHHRCSPQPTATTAARQHPSRVMRYPGLWDSPDFVRYHVAPAAVSGVAGQGGGRHQCQGAGDEDQRTPGDL